MKFIRKHKLTESYIKTVDTMKAALNNKRTADDIRKDTKSIVLDSNRNLIDKQ